MSKLRIIIGQGTATEVYRATLSPADGFDTIVLGPKGLWATLPGEHRMGQTPELLHLPGQPVPEHSTATGTTEQGMTGFLDVHSYQQGLLDLAKQNDQRPGSIVKIQVGKDKIKLDEIRATSVTRGGRVGQLIVRTTEPKLSLIADQVILATGIGPQSKPEGKITHGTPANRLGYPQLMEGIEYLDSKGPYGKSVAVFGGSATAAWVATEALARADEMIWFTRSGGSLFNGCTLPGDRNYQILQATLNLRMVADLERIDYLPEIREGGKLLRMPKVQLALKLANGLTKVCLVDQLIYSIGGDRDGSGAISNILSAELRKDLEPLKDHNRVISDGNGVLALATPDRSLLVIGAATYNYATDTFKKQTAPMATLPTASQVPDGIAMITASLQAVNSYMPFKQDKDGYVTENGLNINLANRDQLAVYLAVFFPDLSPLKCNEIVTRIISVRGSKTPGMEFGITRDRFYQIIGQYA